MNISGREFSKTTIDLVKGLVDLKPFASLRSVALEICQKLNWYSPNGKPKIMSGLQALKKLQRKGIIDLPRNENSRKAHQKKTTFSQISYPLVECEIAELGQLDIVIICDSNSIEGRTWKNLMENFHYLGNCNFFGAQIKYLIKSNLYGPVAALCFSSSAWSIKSRDEYIGWSHSARKHNLNLVISNSRFLIPAFIRVPNLASHVLSLCTERLPEDWKNKYCYEPVLIETFVDREKFDGTVYKAANWLYSGTTVGRGRQDRAMKFPETKKDIYLFPLTPNWRKGLQDCPPEHDKPVLSRKIPEDWAEEEFGNVAIGDKRLNQRLLNIARNFYSNPGAQIPEACKTVAESKATYRFFGNELTEFNKILAPHISASIKRCSEYSTVLVPQDTSTLNYTAHPTTEDLGPIGTSEQTLMGLIMHDTMAFSTDGTPLGLLNVQCWARDPKQKGSAKNRHKLPIDDKESLKWIKSFKAVNEANRECPNTTFVSICDREGDIYDLFVEAGKKENCAKLLVRSEKSRNRKTDGDFIWDKIKSVASSGIQEVRIPRKGSKPSRIAKLEIRFLPCIFTPPKGRVKENLPNVSLYAVHAIEVDSSVENPVDWLLFTNIPVTSFEEACEKIEWYTKRWGIEIFHRTLKSGCKVEDRQLGNAGSIETCLAIDLVVAWRIYYAARLGRETPNLPCTIFFSDDEWKALVAYKTKNPIPPSHPPTIREAIRMVASLGGFLGRKGDGEPGAQTMWRGIVALGYITSAYEIFAPKNDLLSSTDTYG